jgi:hypothetical protein
MYKDYEKQIDIATFDSLQEEIHTGFSEALPLAIEGTWSRQYTNNLQTSQPLGIKLISQAMEEFTALPNSSLIKQTGLELYDSNRSQFTTYLKIAMQAYDPYRYYPILNNALSTYFPNVLKWVNGLDVFSNVDNVTFIVCEHNGITWERKELDCPSDFLYIRPNLEKPTYLWDPVNKTRTYINSRAAHWDNKCWFGGDKIIRQSYALRIDGTFK